MSESRISAEGEPHVDPGNDNGEPRQGPPSQVVDSRDVPVGLGRVELPTSRLSGVRSNHLSYRPRRSR